MTVFSSSDLTFPGRLLITLGFVETPLLPVTGDVRAVDFLLLLLLLAVIGRFLLKTQSRPVVKLPYRGLDDPGQGNVEIGGSFLDQL